MHEVKNEILANFSSLLASRHHVVGTVLSVVMVMSHYSIYCCGLSLRSVLYINSLISIVFGACFLLVSPQFFV